MGTDDILPHALRTKYVIKARGYTVEHNNLHQDNQSSMRLLTSGPLSSSKQTKHIKATFFLAKNKIEDGDVELEYCTTELMWINMHTEPKQGTPFRLNRSKLMSIPVEYDDEKEKRNTNPMLLPSEKKKPFIPYIDPYLEAKYVGIRNMNH